MQHRCTHHSADRNEKRAHADPQDEIDSTTVHSFLFFSSLDPKDSMKIGIKQSPGPETELTVVFKSHPQERHASMVCVLGTRAEITKTTLGEHYTFGMLAWNDDCTPPVNLIFILSFPFWGPGLLLQWWNEITLFIYLCIEKRGDNIIIINGKIN